MKKLFSIIVILSLLMSLLTFNVNAAEVRVSGGEYQVGENFSIPITFKGDFPLTSVLATISYNKSVIRLNSVSGVPAENLENDSFIDENFKNNSTSGSYTLNFTALTAGNTDVAVTIEGSDGEKACGDSKSAKVSVVAPKPSSNANLASIRLSNGSLSPAFNPNTTNYNVTVKYGVESITINGAVADGKSTYKGGGTFDLDVGDQNECILTVTAEDGTKKTYTINIKRMTEEETRIAEEEARDANPLLVVIGNEDYTIVNDIDDDIIPTGFTKETATRKEQEITVLNSTDGKYQLCWLVDAAGENGAFYRRDENDNFIKLAYINANDIMYIIEDIDKDIDIPSGFELVRYELDGQMVDAIQRESEESKEFYIFNCYVAGQTENKFYHYDTVEGTMQRAIEFYSALEGGDSQEIVIGGNTTTNPIGNNDSSWFNSMNKTGKLVFFCIIAVGVLIIVIAILLIVKIVSSKDDDYDDDNGYGTQSNEDYVFGDSDDTEEIFPFPIQADESQHAPITERLSNIQEKTQPEESSDTSAE